MSLVTQAILLYVSGKREEGISRVNSLLSSADESIKYNYLQVRSNVDPIPSTHNLTKVLGNMHLKQGDFERAMTLFGQAQSHGLSRQGFHLVTILLAGLPMIFGMMN